MYIPQNLPDIFEQSVVELDRRKIFNQSINMIITRLQKLCAIEKNKRNQFNVKYGDQTPKNILPELQESLPEFHISGNVKLDLDIVNKNQDTFKKYMKEIFSEVKVEFEVQIQKTQEKSKLNNKEVEEFLQ